MHGTYNVPEKFKDEDKWFKMTKRQLGIILPVVILVLLINIAVFASIFRLFLPFTLIIGFVIIIAAILIAFIPIPNTKYILGGGLYMDAILFRILKKKIGYNKKIYTKHYRNDNEEWIDK